MILSIDTSGHEIIVVGVAVDGKKTEQVSEIKGAKAQMVLPMIEALLRETGLTLKDITEIKVNTGPGSFTGLRVGISIANMLGLLLSVPVNGQPPGAVITPSYDPSKFDIVES